MIGSSFEAERTAKRANRTKKSKKKIGPKRARAWRVDWFFSSQTSYRDDLLRIECSMFLVCRVINGVCSFFERSAARACIDRVRLIDLFKSYQVWMYALLSGWSFEVLRSFLNFSGLSIIVSSRVLGVFFCQGLTIMLSVGSPKLGKRTRYRRFHSRYSLSVCEKKFVPAGLHSLVFYVGFQGGLRREPKQNPISTTKKSKAHSY